MSRHFDRRISLAVSRRLANTRVTPDQMTLVATAIGVAAAPFFVSDRRPCSRSAARCFSSTRSSTDATASSRV
jgi:hypothetical protein